MDKVMVEVSDANGMVLDKSALSDVLSITQPSQIRLGLSPAQVESFEKVGNDLHITLTSGKQFVIAGFFVVEDDERSELYLEDGNEVWWGQYEPSWSGFDFVKMQEVAGIPLWAAASGGVAAFAGLVSVLDNDANGKSPDQPPADPSSPTVKGVSNNFDADGSLISTNVSGTAQPGSTVEVRDPDSGEVIGSAEANSEGNYTITAEPALEDGKDYDVVAVDGQGNTSEPALATGDTTPPESPVVDEVVNTLGGTEISGTAETGSTLELRDPETGEVIGTATADADGNFTITAEPALEDGKDYNVVAVDGLGNASEPAIVTGDTSAPENPVVDEVVNTLAGTEISGTAETGSTLELRDPETGEVIGTATADADGNFTITAEPALEDGKDYNVVAVDDHGNVSQPAVATVDNNFSEEPEVDDNNVSVEDSTPEEPEVDDTSAPDTPVVDDVTNGFDESGASISTDVSGTAEPNSTVELRDPVTSDVIGTAQADGEGNFSITSEPALEDGVDYDVVSVDDLGNVSEPAIATGDTSAPDAPVVEEVTNGFDESGAPINTEVSGAAEPNSNVELRDPNTGDVIGKTQADSEGNFSITTEPALEDGVDYDVVSVDDLGNVSDPAVATGDTSAPDTPAVDNVTNAFDQNGDPVSTDVSGTAEPSATVEVRDPDTGDVVGTAEVDEDGNYTATAEPALEDGKDFDVVALDDAGNTSDPATATGDTTAPDTPVVDEVVNVIGGTEVNGTAEPDSKVEIIDPDTGEVIGTAQTDTDGNYTVITDPTLEDGKLYDVIAIDDTGNRSDPAQAEGSDAPSIGDATNTLGETSIDGVISDDSSTTINGSAEPGSTVELRDPETGEVVGTAEADDEGNYSITAEPALEDGKDYDVVAVVDGEDTDSAKLTGDTTAPEAPEIEEVTNAFDENGDPVSTDVSGTAEPGATVEVRDPDTGDVVGTAEVDEDGNYTVTAEPALDDGKDYDVVAVDEAGNTSAPTTATGDTTAPESPMVEEVMNAFDQNGDPVSTDVSGTAEPGATVEVRDPDTGDVVGTAEVDEDGNYTVTAEPALDDGKDYDVVAVDEAGNTSAPATATGPSLDQLAELTLTGLDTTAVTETETNATVSGSVNDVEEGRNVAITVSQGGFSKSALATVDTSGNFSTTVDMAGFTDASSGNPITTTATVTDLAGNEGSDVSTNTSFALNIAPDVEESLDLSTDPELFGQLIAPISLVIDDAWRTFYFWDTNKDGGITTDDRFAISHNSANPNETGGVENGLADIFNNGNYIRDEHSGGDIDQRSYTMDDGTILRLPTLNGDAGTQTPTGTVSDPAENQTQNDGLVAIWDAYDDIRDIWKAGGYATATPTPDGNNHMGFTIHNDTVNENELDSTTRYVALEVIGGDNASNIQLTPVVLDLNQDGDINYADTQVELPGGGGATTAWAGPEDGVLMWDKFGDQSLQTLDQVAFTEFGGDTDLEGLALGFDSNDDGVFDADDDAFDAFGIWQDANANGELDAGEFLTLDDAGIIAINLESDGVENQPHDGVQEAGRGSAVMADGGEMLLADTAFAYQLKQQEEEALSVI